LVSRFGLCAMHGFARRVGFKWGAGTLLLSALVAAPACLAGSEEIKPLRLCADPTNLPFSSDKPETPGLYLEIGQAIAQKLGRPVAYNWYKSYFGKRTVRETLLSKRCDAMVGLPLVDGFMGPAVIFSKPIAREGYALVSAGGRKVTSVDDLEGLRVAVQYESTPQNVLALHDEIKKITVLSPDEGMKALDEGKVDVAFIWAPVAGWLNKTVYENKYLIAMTSGEGLLWETAIGLARNSGELRDQINAVLPDLQGDIDRLFLKYGVPNSIPIKFGELARPNPSAGSGEPSTVGQATESKPAEIKAAGTNTEAGQELFNSTCAHCHGPNAVQSERRIDLRLLKKRYGDDMEATFWKAVHEGRPSKGMPAWKEVFNDDELRNVYAYLQTLQSSSDN
jgi:polar amino acid transport system substrate-binding protein